MHALALEHARLQLEARQAVRARDELLSLMAHDLHEHVDAIVRLTGDVLLRSVAGDDDGTMLIMSRDEVESIRASSRQAAGLIRDVQDAEQVAAGRLPLEHQVVDLAELLHEAAERFEPVMVDAALRFVRVWDPGALPLLHGDRARLSQLLSKLLANAVRFTPHGGQITLRAVADGQQVLLGVRDTGPGIPAAEIPRLFERHGQAPRLLRAGAGLGLFLCQGIVHAHGGEIGITSAVGEGTDVWCTLPTGAAAR